MSTYRCPVHGIPDCSPLLNGCSRVTQHYRASQDPETEIGPQNGAQEPTDPDEPDRPVGEWPPLLEYTNNIINQETK